MADEPAPQIGQIVEHHFLWFDEAAVGRSEGQKARPCLIVAVEPLSGSGSSRVTVLPITSQRPRADSTTVEIPDGLKARMGLDTERDAWVVTEDANVFVWPGFDLVPQSHGSFVRGAVTAVFFRRVRDTVAALHARDRATRSVDRD